MELKKERLDGLSSKLKHHDISLDISECLYSGSDFGHSSKPNRKGRHVTWGDVEMLRKSSRQRDMGFVVGQTDWHQMVDPSAHEKLLKRGKLESKSSQSRPNDYTIKKAKEALVRVKYI
ncbi:hypothetical protein Ciccas_010324 [Cichlidogyrus casuarinus]|uniref:Uncharacterized protein n=1 Tax=Cichlidogyrus casuarinus TaxID=1844966 RepID=A0ABD2PUT0_9PLAT